MKVIVAPDKFKGSLTSFQACEAIAAGIKAADASIRIECFPMADGGDGFASVLKYYFHTETIPCHAEDPLGRPLEASYEWDRWTETAIVELARASGLVLLKEDERNTLDTSTRGTGLIIKQAIEKGAKKIILGLGGSATTDAGTGILSALGFHFLGEGGQLLFPNGANLSRIRQILPPSFIPTVLFEIAVDVQNILYGHEGAAFIYGPQKGATPEAVNELDAGLRNFSRVLLATTGKDVSAIPGTGAAGGIAAGLLGFFDIEMKEGVELVIAAGGLLKELRDADVLITGEGKIDRQSGSGKVVGRMGAIAKELDIPGLALCGLLDADEEALRELGLEYAVSIRDGQTSQDDAMRNAFGLLENRTTRMIRDLPYFT